MKNIITNMGYKKLTNKARKLRQDTFLAFIKKGEAHLGGSFSMIEILLTLYEIVMKKNDKFILSKAHASFPLCLLLKEKGLKPRLTTHLEIDTKTEYIVPLVAWDTDFLSQWEWHLPESNKKFLAKFM